MIMEEAQIEELTEDDPFHFDCHRQVPCFNQCCRDLNQFLTPYDIIRLKNHLNLTADLFLKTYTETHFGPQTRLPVITLKPGEGGACPFVTPSGCSIYENRPSSCRMYPIIRVLSRSRESGEKYIRYALLKEPHCRGFEQSRQITVREWMTGQGLLPFNEMNDLMMDIVSLKNQNMPGYLTDDSARLFFTLCYDMEGFRDGVCDLSGRRIDVPEMAINDDMELLRFGMAYLKQNVFGGII
jgi:Fe-S-cluster containining protein